MPYAGTVLRFGITLRVWPLGSVSEYEIVDVIGGNPHGVPCVEPVRPVAAVQPCRRLIGPPSSPPRCPRSASTTSYRAVRPFSAVGSRSWARPSRTDVKHEYSTSRTGPVGVRVPSGSGRWPVPCSVPGKPGRSLTMNRSTGDAGSRTRPELDTSSPARYIEGVVRCPSRQHRPP